MDALTSSFQDDLKNAIKDKYSLLLQNSSREKAVAVSETMFGSAEKEVIFLTHRLSREIYAQQSVIDALRHAYEIHPNMKCIAMVRSPFAEQSDFLNILIAHGAGIYCNVDNILRDASETSKLAHKLQKIQDCLVVDRNTARIETDSDTRQADVLVGGAAPDNNRPRIDKAYKELRQLHHLLKSHYSTNE